jgi:ParB family chromosome partitioning protein
VETTQNTHGLGSKKKAGLGRGLGSLLGDLETTPKERPEAPAESNRVILAEVTQLHGNPGQPRRHFDAEKLKELAASIKEKGIIQPILVRKTKDKNLYEIIAGERRWRAAQLAGLHEVPILIKDSDDRTTLELALIENIQRADLGPLEEAEAYQRLASEHHMTQSEIAQKVGKDRTTVANSLRLLELAREVKELLMSGALSVGHAKVLLSLPSQADQISVAREVAHKKLSVRATEKLVAERLSPAQTLEAGV